MISVNASPELVQKMKINRFFEVQCPQCKRKFRLGDLTPKLFVDSDIEKVRTPDKGGNGYNYDCPVSYSDILSAMVIGDKIKRLEGLDVNRLLDEVLKEIEDFIIELNKEQLYDKGQIDVNNPTVREHYAESTKLQKLKKAQFKKTEFVTLRWGEEFYESFKIIIFEKEFIISATDLKWANFLENNMRFSNALGLTPESRDKLKAEILPLMIKKLRDEL